MLRHALLAVTLLASTAPALAREPRTARVCNEAGRCRQAPQAQIRRALLAVTAQPSATGATASAATNRRQLNALLARLR